MANRLFALNLLNFTIKKILSSSNYDCKDAEPKFKSEKEKFSLMFL